MVTAAATAPCIRLRARIDRPVPDAVVEWRFDELERAGVDTLDAIRLALDLGFDVAALRALVRRGCEVTLALRILH